MGLGRQREKVQKPKRSKCCKRRASSMQNTCTVPATPAWRSTRWGVGKTEPHCCSHWGHHPTTRPSNEMATSSLAPLSNRGTMAEPSPVALHWERGAFEQEEQITHQVKSFCQAGCKAAQAKPPDCVSRAHYAVLH